MIVKVTIRDGEKHTSRITAVQAQRDQQHLIDAGMVIARSNAFQTELRCKRTANSTVFTDAAIFNPTELRA